MVFVSLLAPGRVMGRQMHPTIRIVLAIVGAVFGASLASEGGHLFAIVLGALAGLAIGEMVFIRDRLTKLQSDLEDLRHRRGERPPAPAPTQEPVQRLREAAPYIAPRATPEVPSPRPATTTAPGPVPVPSTRAAESGSPARPLDESYADRENPILKLLREYFTGGNALVRAGVVVLFFGVAFLLRYLAEHTHVPIELRLSAVAFGALILLVLGWRLREKRRGYALALQGGATGILYLTVFSALHLYSLLGASAAFGLLAAISALAASLAVLQSSLAVALLAVTGGFLAPFLASTGSGNYVVLFSYFLVLNALILAVAWFRSWRALNLAGFGFTFVLSTLWGVLQYRPQDFPTAEPFLVAFFLTYVAIAVLYGRRAASTSQRYIDGTILFGTPIAAFGLQAAMLHDQRLALAYSALATSALYIALAWILQRRRGDVQRLLVEAFMALGVAFLTLAIPLALNGRWSSASWALEGAALIWVGCRQNRRLPRAFGALLQLAAGAALGLSITSGAPVPAGTYVACLMVGIASVFSGLFTHANRAQLADYEWSFPNILFFWGLLWWCIGGVSELGQHLDKTYALSSTLTFAAVTALLCGEIARRTQFRIALLPTFGLAAAMVLFGIRAGISLQHPLAQGGWLSWPVAFLGIYLILRRHGDELAAPMANTLHPVVLWLLTALASWELAWTTERAVGSSGAWHTIAWAIPALALLAALPQAERRIRWPLQAHRRAYLAVASVGFALYLGLWSFETDVVVSSPSSPLPYFPILNPLDITQALVLFALARFWVRLRPEGSVDAASVDLRPIGFAVAALGFLWLNAVLLRTLHLWTGIPYELKAMLASTLVESALSIFWATIALTTMLIATRIRTRIVWLAGAVLLVVVVAKLFLIDLSSIGTVERIVSFVGVGLLMLVLGYFSPLPPALEERTP